jgi:hypothetical protein
MVILSSPKPGPSYLGSLEMDCITNIVKEARKQKLKIWEVEIGIRSYLKWKLNQMRLTLDMRQAGGDWLPMANLMHICFFVLEVFFMEKIMERLRIILI